MAAGALWKFDPWWGLDQYHRPTEPRATIAFPTHVQTPIWACGYATSMILVPHLRTECIELSSFSFMLFSTFLGFFSGHFHLPSIWLLDMINPVSGTFNCMVNWKSIVLYELYCCYCTIPELNDVEKKRCTTLEKKTRSLQAQPLTACGKRVQEMLNNRICYCMSLATLDMRVEIIVSKIINIISDNDGDENDMRWHRKQFYSSLDRLRPLIWRTVDQKQDESKKAENIALLPRIGKQNFHFSYGVGIIVT